MKLTPLLLLLLATPAQANSIAGQWTYQADVFGGECTPNGETHTTTVTIQQTENQFTTQGGLTCQGRCMEADKHRAIGSGTITGDRIQSQDAENILRWVGRLSPDSSRIQGKATCQMGGGGTGRGEFPFTMQRQTRTAQSIPTQPSPARTSPTQPNLPANENPNYIRPDFDDSETPTVAAAPIDRAPTTQPPIAKETSAQPQTVNFAMIYGEWVTFLGKPLKNYGSADKIVQRAVDFQLTSGISGEKFYGTISGNQITLDLNGKMIGTVSSNGNLIRFSDMAMVRLGSPTCGSIATCQLP